MPEFSTADLRTYVYVDPLGDYNKDISISVDDDLAVYVLHDCGLKTFDSSSCQLTMDVCEGIGDYTNTLHLSAGWNVIFYWYINEYTLAGLRFNDVSQMFRNDPKILYMSNTYSDAYSNNGDSNESICTHVFSGDWLGTAPGEYKCCGDDASDEGYVSGDQICHNGVWHDLGTTRCGPNEEGIFNTNVYDELVASGQYNSAATDGRDACCGDDAGDYGYVVNPDKDYMCYNYKYALSNPHDENVWLDAKNSDIAFKIYGLNVSNHQFDILSNSDQWNYCNAAPASNNANPIPELGTFTSGTLSDNMECHEFMGLLTGLPYEVCDNSGNYPCCTDSSNVVLSDPNTYRNCQDDCYDPSGNPIDPCTIPQFAPFCSAGTLGGGSADYIAKLLCGFDFQNCLEGSFYSPDKDCTAQSPSGWGEVCDDENDVCTNGGLLVNTSDDPAVTCCYGPETGKCRPKDSFMYCSDVNSYSYDPTNEECPEGYDSFQSQSGEYCCGGPPQPISRSIVSTFQTRLNISFICYNENGKSKFAECCWGAECSNYANLVGNVAFIDAAKGRVESTGGALHTIRNYDKLENGVIVDKILKASGAQVISASLPNSQPMTGYKYIEFNIAYNNEGLVGNLIVNGTDYGPLKNFLVDGSSKMRWHHAVVPIASSQQNIVLEKIAVTVLESTSVDLVIDNIILTPDASSQSSPNYLCSGGFSTWVDDYEPNGVPFNDPRFENPYWVGQYIFVCNSQGPFGWTGHQCCGDDTRYNYGEFFSDSEKGCFNGTAISNDWSVGYAKGIIESEDPQAYKKYTYKDLIYNTDEFIACQEPQGKYDTLETSFDGTTQSGRLVNTNVHDECRVIGSYYCSRNTWTQKIPMEEGSEYVWTGQDLYSKSVPPDTNLVKNGDFGGDCPPTVCTQNQGGSGT